MVAEGHRRMACGRHGFNRTFMELKLSQIDVTELRPGSFNRTFMELKWDRAHIPHKDVEF